MPDEKPLLSVDEQGIWETRRGKRDLVIAWADIYRVGAYRLDCITYSVGVVEVDWDYGEYFSLCDDWPGFEDVASAISSRLEGALLGWRERLRNADARDKAIIEVWQRPG